MAKLLIATNNQGKVNEIKTLLKDFYDEVVSLKDENIDLEVEEDGATFEYNAAKKAREAYALTGLDTLADDSGLCVTYLDDAPGVYSARYAGENATYADNNDKLLHALKNANAGERDAKFVCVAAMIKDGKLITAKGEVKGEITRKARGENGFGYDPVFYIKRYQKTFAELDPDLKNAISHRAAALRNLKEKLKHMKEK